LKILRHCMAWPFTVWSLLPRMFGERNGAAPRKNSIIA
jgi:hypothetical protein